MIGNASVKCRDGIIVPALGTSLPHAVLYFFALLYCFLGIAIAADVFMCSVETITSKTKLVFKVKIKKG